MFFNAAINALAPLKREMQSVARFAFNWIFSRVKFNYDLKLNIDFSLQLRKTKQIPFSCR
jgi:hypothetical protein